MAPVSHGLDVLRHHHVGPASAAAVVSLNQIFLLVVRSSLDQAMASLAIPSSVNDRSLVVSGGEALVGGRARSGWERRGRV